MRDRFGASHALKSPPHITLQMPFRRTVDQEAAIVETLGVFAAKEYSFIIDLQGFDCFSPRVIFIRVKDHQPIAELHARLNQLLTNQLDFKQKELTARIHPHMTIATRDLPPEAFNKAWPALEGRSFEGSFRANAITLLKHNGKHWDVFKEFGFRKDQII
jgi:2'-5' RNA ligase